MIKQRRRREVPTYVELVRMTNSMVAYFENLVGKRAEAVQHLGVNEYVQISGARTEMPDLTIDWIGVGKTEREYKWHETWGKPPSEKLPCLRFNRAGDHVSEFFNQDEPYWYRVVFRETTEGLKFIGAERWVEVEEGEVWQTCDETTTYLIVKTMYDLLPRLNQQGE